MTLQGKSNTDIVISDRSMDDPASSFDVPPGARTRPGYPTMMR